MKTAAVYALAGAVSEDKLDRRHMPDPLDKNSRRNSEGCGTGCSKIGNGKSLKAIRQVMPFKSNTAADAITAKGV